MSKLLPLGISVVAIAALGGLFSISKPPDISAPVPETKAKVACQYSCDGEDRDCSDFSSQEEAQTFFTCCGFSEDDDPMRLDSVKVGNGVACEALP